MSKSKFIAEEVKYMSLILSLKGIHADPEKVKAIQNLWVSQ
jgi:hypothetical protein